jgi:ubiquinone/menaquinone biosynthesis C-methylase UbiE
MNVVTYTNRYKEILYQAILAHCQSGQTYILDIGCNDGQDIKRLSLSGKELKIFGLDMNREALKKGLKRLAGAEDAYLVQGKGEAIPFRANSFDVVYSSEVIEHTSDPGGFIAESWRVLSINGIFIITTPSRFNYATLAGTLVPRTLKIHLRRFIYYVKPGPDIDPHFREYTPKELNDLLQQNKFMVEKIIPGVMRVPFWYLFEKFPILVSIWEKFDKLVGLVPGGNHLKANYVLLAKKITVADPHMKEGRS